MKNLDHLPHRTSRSKQKFRALAGPGARSTLIFSYICIYVYAWPIFFWFEILNFNIFWGFQLINIFMGIMILWICFGVITNLD